EANTMAVAGGFIAVAVAASSPSIHSNANVLLEGTTSTGTVLRGTQGVDLRAEQKNVVPVQGRVPIPVGFIPIPIAAGDSTNDLHTNVDGAPGVTVFAGPRPIPNKTVAAGDPQATTLVTRTNFDRLALFVEAAHIGTQGENANARNINWDSDVVI